MSTQDTIFAQASARGKAGVAVVRLSGPKAWEAAETLCGTLPQPRKAALRRLSDPAQGFLDQALVLCFSENASFTGEQVVELHLHGSLATVSAVLSALSSISGLRLAEAGEFTRRALENGCMDLTQVEGLGDLLDAETEAQRIQALRVLSGALGQKAEQWRSRLIRAAALLEATIDFADEDVPEDVLPEVRDLIKTTKSELEAEIEGSRISERIRDGFEVAIVGPPNVGKSTLLNRLAGREAALTSEIAGTTRDVIEVRMDLAGLPVTVLDTAGLRETDDVVETLGIELARSRAENADLRVFIFDGDGNDGLGIQPKPDDITLLGKADLDSNIVSNGISGMTGLGVDDLVTMVSTVLENRSTGAATATRQRHRSSLRSTADALSMTLSVIERSPDLGELAAEEMYQGVRSLDSLIGRVDVEHVLDEIFSSFCLGK